MDERSDLAAPAGWYPDPTRRSEFRYFNGNRWTADVSIDGHRFVDDFDAPQLPGRTDGTRTEIDSPSRTFAVLSFIFGSGGMVIAWLPFLFIVGGLAGGTAIVLGVIALGRIRRNEAAGRGFAIAGMATAVVALCLCVIGFVWTGRVVHEFVEFVDTGPLTAVVTECDSDGLQVTMAGTIENRDDRVHDYVISVEVGDGVGSTVTSFVHVFDVAAGEQRTWTFQQIARNIDQDRVQCDVLHVNGPFPFGLSES